MGIASNEFYVFTHPSFADPMSEQTTEMLETTRNGADPDYRVPDFEAFRFRAGASET